MSASERTAHGTHGQHGYQPLPCDPCVPWGTSDWKTTFGCFVCFVGHPPNFRRRKTMAALWQIFL